VQELNRQRALAVAGVAGLMIIGLVMLILVASALNGDDEREVASAPVAAKTPRPTPTAKPKPTPVPLTAEQRAARDAAAQLVESKGFEVLRKRDYDPRRKLRVLIGEDTAGGRLAFFFVDGTYIGNDRTSSSPKLKVKRAGNVQVTLTYDDGTDVRFRWDGSRLAPQDPLPG
jgi:hypothetical protein